MNQQEFERSIRVFAASTFKKNKEESPKEFYGSRSYQLMLEFLAGSGWGILLALAIRTIL